MGMALLIVGGMWLALQSQEGAYRAQGAERESRQMLEGVAQQLQQDLQQAGAGLPPQTLPALTPGSDDGNPVITIRYLRKAPFVTKLTAPGSERSKLFRIPPDDIRHFRQGDQVLVHHDGTWQSFRVQAVGSHSSPRLTLASDVLRNVKGRTVWLTFPPGSEVARLRDAEVEYVLAQGKRGNRTLVRRHGTQETVVASGVQDFRFDYLVAPPDGDEAASPGWTAQPPPDTPILGARVHLAIGQSTTHFTVTPRNLFPKSPS
jgi:hypothetical protein